MTLANELTSVIWRSREMLLNGLSFVQKIRQNGSCEPAHQGASPKNLPVKGIITPYRLQKNMVLDLIKGSELEGVVKVGTVYAYQGLECNVIILDLVDAPGLALSSFTRGKEGSSSMRLINVAVTRARDKLLIVAHVRHLLDGVSEHFTLPQVIQRACQIKHIMV